MSAARPLSSLLTAGAVALVLAAPGTALAEPGHGSEPERDKGGAAASGSHGGKDARQDAREDAHARPAGEGQTAEQADEQEPRRSTPATAGNKPQRTEDKPAQPAKAAKPARPAKPAKQPAAATVDTTPRSGSGDPAGNNGTIKIDTVPGDPDRANRPHPGCAFVVQFFNFDADQHADITFTGQAPTRSSGPLLTLSDQLISTSPADGALEEGHSLTLTAADLGLVGTPTAAKGWHVKVAVDALEAPGGAKQKVFWLDCATGEAVLEQEPDDADVSAAGAGAELAEPPAVEQATDERRLSGSSDGVAVLSGSADREVASETAVEDAAAVRGQDVAQGRSTTSTLASVLPFAVPAALPFTGAAGVTGLLVGGLAAVAAGALALRAGRRRTPA